MDAKVIANENCILKYEVGSKLYGTDTPTSDTDYSGIFIANKEYYFGLFSIDQVDVSEQSKLESGKNDTDAIDFTLYEIRKFIRLATDNNPNILEQLFVPENKIIHSTKYGMQLLENSNIFPHQGLYHRFVGYAHSQKKKMCIKTEHYNKLEEVVGFLQSTENHKEKVETIVPQLKSKFNLHTEDIVLEHNYIQHNVIVGDSKIPFDFTIAKAMEGLGGRIKIFSNRKELVSRYGYEVKFGSHVIRLLDEALELITTGKVKFPLRNADMIRDIKCGKYTLEQLYAIADKLEKEIEVALVTCNLPTHPNTEKINKLLISTIEDFIAERT